MVTIDHNTGDFELVVYDKGDDNERTLISGCLDGWRVSAWFRRDTAGAYYLGRAGDTELQALHLSIHASKSYGRKRASLAVRRRLADRLQSYLNRRLNVPKKRIETRTISEQLADEARRESDVKVRQVVVTRTRISPAPSRH